MLILFSDLLKSYCLPVAIRFHLPVCFCRRERALQRGPAASTDGPGGGGGRWSHCSPSTGQGRPSLLCLGEGDGVTPLPVHKCACVWAPLASHEMTVSLNGCILLTFATCRSRQARLRSAVWGPFAQGISHSPEGKCWGRGWNLLGGMLWLSACSVMSDSATPWTAAHQAPLSMGFSRQEDWRRLAFPPPGGPPDSGTEPESPASSSLARGFFYLWAAGNALPGGTVAWKIQPDVHLSVWEALADNRSFFLKPGTCPSNESAVRLLSEWRGKQGSNTPDPTWRTRDLFQEGCFQDTDTVTRRLADPAQVSWQGGFHPLSSLVGPQGELCHHLVQRDTLIRERERARVINIQIPPLTIHPQCKTPFRESDQPSTSPASAGRSQKIKASTPLVAQMVRNPHAVQKTCIWSQGQEDPPEKEMATHSNILAWEIPWTEEPGGL